MTCPKCGLPALPDQKFCRTCGASLQVTTNPLVEPAALADQESISELNFKDESHPTHRWMLWGFIVMFVGVAIGVIGKKFHYDVFAVVGILMSLVGIFLSVYPHLTPATRRKHSDRLSAEPEQLTQSQPVSALQNESPIQYVPSITERTTNLLKTPAAPTPDREKTNSRLLKAVSLRLERQ